MFFKVREKSGQVRETLKCQKVREKSGNFVLFGQKIDILMLEVSV